MSIDVAYYRQRYGDNWREEAPLVYAFHPRSVDPPAAVAEDVDGLKELEGSFVGAEQCDSCGNASYRIERRERARADGTVQTRWVAVCAADPDEDPEFVHPSPCGREWWLGLRYEYECTF